MGIYLGSDPISLYIGGQNEGEDIQPELAEQETLITNIQEALVGKAYGANATPETILKGYSAYVHQELVEGTLELSEPEVTIVTWAGGTDDEIAAMVEAADAGQINLADYWAVGDERTVTLSAMPATGVGESHVSQIVTMVLMNAGGKTLESATPGGRTTCNFIVGLKNGLSEYGYMNSANTNVGGWKDSARRTWCNNIFKDTIPAAIKPIFKPFVNKSGTGNSSTSGTENTTDTFALPAEIEVFGSTTYSVAGEGNQFQWYQTAANRVKKNGDSGSANNWWERSPSSGNSAGFCSVYNSGIAAGISASSARLIAPFGCI